MTKPRPILFLKATVPAHTRRTASGKTVTVTAYERHDGGRSTALVAKHPKSGQSSGAHYGHVTPPADLPSDAVAFVARNPHRPERFGLFRPDGSLSNHFAQDEGPEAIAEALAKHNMRMDEKGHVFRAA